MKKITTLICLFTSMSLTYAQEEVTATYLKNADFDSQPTFTDNSGETEAELSGRAYLIEGWTKESNDDWFRAATSNYGLEFESIPDALNSVNPPANDINGEAEGAVLMMSAAWGNTAQMSQSVSLPAGTYELSYDVLNQNAGRSLRQTYLVLYRKKVHLYMGQLPRSPTHGQQKLLNSPLMMPPKAKSV